MGYSFLYLSCLAVLQLHKASKSFGKKEVLKEVSFTLETGSILGIFGRNGSGKSTLLKLMYGTLKGGRIEMEIDKIPVQPSEVITKRCIGYLPQHPFMPKNTKVRDVIPMYFKQEAQQDSIFYDPFVAKFASRTIGELSTGQGRYLGLLLLAHLDHPFLFLDEPFSMIDPLQVVPLKELLLKIKTTKGIIITDHYYQDVLDISSKNLLIHQGEGISISTAKELQKFGYLSSNRDISEKE